MKFRYKKPLFNTDNLPTIVVAVCIFFIGIWVGNTFEIPLLTHNQAKINVTNKLFSKDNVDFSTFWQVWDQINATYLNKKDLSGQKLMQGAISGLVSAVGDPYTLYFDPSANQAFSEVLSGTFQGVGIELAIKDNHLIVIAPLDGSPAAKSGILAGDIILKIDDKDASKLSIGDAVKAIRGKPGTKVSLSLSRSGRDQPIDLTLTRAEITVPSVNLEEKNGVGIVTLSQFGDNTKSEWDKIVNKLTADGISRIVLDLRNDPGGRLDTAVYVASDFLSKSDTVVLEVDADGNKQVTFGDHEGRLQSDKLIVLINKGSASASEIVTGALADNKKATIIGETSFGKGVVQSVTDLNDGSGLHITIAKWLTPNGTWIHGKGITPDITVVRTEADISSGKDPQLDKALDLLK